MLCFLKQIVKDLWEKAGKGPRSRDIRAKEWGSCSVTKSSILENRADFQMSFGVWLPGFPCVRMASFPLGSHFAPLHVPERSCCSGG